MVLLCWLFTIKMPASYLPCTSFHGTLFCVYFPMYIPWSHGRRYWGRSGYGAGIVHTQLQLGRQVSSSEQPFRGCQHQRYRFGRSCNKASAIPPLYLLPWDQGIYIGKYTQKRSGPMEGGTGKVGGRNFDPSNLMLGPAKEHSKAGKYPEHQIIENIIFPSNK